MQRPEFAFVVLVRSTALFRDTRRSSHKNLLDLMALTIHQHLAYFFRSLFARFYTQRHHAKTLIIRQSIAETKSCAAGTLVRVYTERQVSTLHIAMTVQNNAYLVEFGAWSKEIVRRNVSGLDGECGNQGVRLQGTLPFWVRARP